MHNAHVFVFIDTCTYTPTTVHECVCVVCACMYKCLYTHSHVCVCRREGHICRHVHMYLYS